MMKDHFPLFIVGLQSSIDVEAIIEPGSAHMIERGDQTIETYLLQEQDMEALRRGAMLVLPINDREFRLILAYEGSPHPTVTP